jgi:hypothetical protein
MERAILGVKKFYDTDRELAVNLMRPVIVLGKPGIGKTVAMRALAVKQLKIGFSEVRLASMSELDLAGLPTITTDEVTGRRETTFAASKLLPIWEPSMEASNRNSEYGILVLDEITACSSAARAVALQLLDASRGVGEYKLPDKWVCVALGNDVDDGGIYEGLEASFLNRCRVVRLEPCFKSWIAWADKNDINPTIMAFLKCYPEMFYVDPDVATGGRRIQASPRSWEGVSTQLNFAEQLNDGKVDASDTELFIGCIASDLDPGIAARLAAFYEYKSEVVDPEEILSGKAKITSKDAGARESIILTLEGVVSKLLKETANVNAMSMSAAQKQRFVNYIKYLGELQKARGSEAAIKGIEDLFRVKAVGGLLTDRAFDKEHPNEMAMLRKAARTIQGT